jgi:hypothetical protein
MGRTNRLFWSKMLAAGLILVAASGICVGQGSNVRWTIGVDALPIQTGTPELWAGRTLNRTFMFVGAVGYTYKPGRWGCLVDDGLDAVHFEGGYARLGLEARSPLADGGQIFVRLSYVGSWYDETGERREWSPITGELESSFERTQGFANGLAFATGWDFILHRSLRLQLGLQVGRSDRREYIGAWCRSLQPGLGYGGGMPARFILGLSYSFPRKDT